MTRIRTNILPLTVALALLMEMIDSTVLSTAIPVVSEDLGVPVLALKMALATYLIALAALVPVSGWIADRFGARRTFVAAMAVFLIASVLCAMQNGLTGLVLARALQGAGGAMMTPVGRLIVLRNTEKASLVRALSWVTVPALVGPAIGPFVGAVVTASLGWRWIFLINLPFGLLAIALALRFLPRDGAPVDTPFDHAGFVLSAAGLVLAMAGLSSLGEHILPTPVALAVSAAGALLLVLYGLRARRRSDSLLDPRLFRYRTFSAGIVGGVLFRLSSGAVSLLLPLLFQIGLGMSILASGALSGLNAVGALGIRAIAPRLLDRFGFRRVLVAASVTRGLTVAGFATVGSPWDLHVIPLLLIGGVAQALVFTAANSMVFADLAPEEMSRGTSFSSVAQQVGLTLGIALAGLTLELAAGSVGTSGIPLPAFAIAFVTMGLAGPAAALVFLRLRPSDADSLRRRIAPRDGAAARPAP